MHYPPVTEPSDPLGRRLALLGKVLRERFSGMLATHDCTVGTWAVLRGAHLYPGLSQAQLAGHLGIEGPTLTRQLDRLCAEGLVLRQRDDRDRRVIRVHLTDVGEKRWTELADVADELEARLTRHLTKSQIAALNTAIVKLRRVLEESDAPFDSNR